MDTKAWDANIYPTQLKETNISTKTINVPQDLVKCKIPRTEIKLGEQIGSGGFSDVYKGNWLRADVAIKKIQINSSLTENEIIKTLYKEALIMLELRHPHVIIFFGISIDETSNEILIIMELMNCSLRDLIKNKVKLNNDEKIKILTEIAHGMSYLHNLNPPILHLDLKSTNILVKQDKNSQSIKIADFGISVTKLSSKIKSSSLTLNYAAPEAILKKGVSEKTDVYSFGIIMWELLTYNIPFAGLAIENFKLQVANEQNPLRPLIPNNCPIEYKSLMEDCWQYSANDRPTFNQILNRLSNITP